MKQIIKILGVLLFLSILILGLCACDDKSESFTVQYSAGAEGRIEGNVNQTVSAGEDAEPVTAVPNSGYIFLKWSDGVTAVTRTDTNVTADISVTALFGELNYNYNFNKVYYSVEYTAGEHGRIEGELHQSVAYLESGTTVKAIPDEGWRFVSWSDGVIEATRTDKNVTADISVTALFEKIEFTIDYTAGEHGKIEGVTFQQVAYLENGTKVTAIADEGYAFVKWSDGKTEATRTDRSIKEDIFVSAIFEKIKYSVEYTAGEHGKIEGATNQQVAYLESSTAVTAVPDEGYEFVRWIDNGSTNPIRFDASIREVIYAFAEFKKKAYTVIYLVEWSDGGYVTGKTIQTIEHGDSTTQVTAIPNEGYHFVQWSDGNTNPSRVDVDIRQDLTITARFALNKYQIEYHSDGNGFIEYPEGRMLEVRHGQNGPTVRADPHKGYVFVKWSDGVTTAERKDYNITSDLNLTAYFGYSATYLINNEEGGVITGGAYQAVAPGEDFCAVEAVPNAGYVFSGWSDLQQQNIRQEMSATQNVEYTAYFEPTVKTFQYEFGIAAGAPFDNEVTIDRNNIQTTRYITPSFPNFTFCGWYADADYQLKVINEDGIYMLGYYGFSLGTDTLYARWEADEGNKLPVFKVLIVCVNEIQATLFPAKKGAEEIEYDMHYTLTAIEREYGALIPELIMERLNEWMDGIVKFEVDCYYTTEVIDEKYITYTPSVTGSYSIAMWNLPETARFKTSYHSLLSLFCMGDFEGQYWNKCAGSASRKYGSIHMEEMYPPNKKIGIPLHLDSIKSDEEKADEFIFTFIHEFIHTCEMAYHWSDPIASFHEVTWGLRFKDGTIVMEEMEAYRRYMLGEAEINGEMCGFPRSFWTDKKEELITNPGIFNK